MEMFLTPAEVKDLTGRTYFAAQRAVLKERGIRFIVDGDGRPKVLRASIEHKLNGKFEAATSEPNFKMFGTA